jgi:MFS family permease
VRNREQQLHDDVARSQARWGRKRSFQAGLIVAAASAAACAHAVSTRSFWLLVATTVVAGFYSANASLYRFAGPELAEWYIGLMTYTPSVELNAL